MAVRVEEFQLLGSGLTSRTPPLRPPWAIEERAFVNTCDHCGECVDACPQHILVCGRGGYPEVDFAYGGCTFCGACRQACDGGGFQETDTPPWNLKAFISRCCLTHQGLECKACGEPCETSAIQFRTQIGGPAVPILDPYLCNGCGKCWSACPAKAIKMFDSIQEGGLLS